MFPLTCCYCGRIDARSAGYVPASLEILRIFVERDAQSACKPGATPFSRRGLLNYAAGLPSLRGPRQAGARSVEVKVFCAPASGVPCRPLPFATEPVSRGESASLKTS